MGVFRYAGVDLSTFGAALSLADGVKGAPPVRGKNILIPYQHGQRHTTKYYDERTIVIQGLITGPGALAVDEAIDNLKQLFPIEAGEQLLEEQQADGTWRGVMAEVRNSLVPMDVQTGNNARKWSLELVASDPIWYSTIFEDAVNRQGWTFDSGVLFDDDAHWFDSGFAYAHRTLSAQVTLLEATNGGTYYTRKPVFTLIGPSNGLEITNTRNGYSLQFVGPATRMIIDCGAQTIDSDAANPAVTLGPGQTDWMRFEAGENTLEIDLGAYVSPVDYQVKYAAAYL